MHRIWFLSATAFVEVAAGLGLLLVPSLVIELLPGHDSAAPNAVFVARIAGSALLAIGVACWIARSDKRGPALLGLLAGVLIYDVAAAALLAHAGLTSGTSGMALLPAVALHAALGLWCAVCLWGKPQGD